MVFKQEKYTLYWVAYRRHLQMLQPHHYALHGIVLIAVAQPIYTLQTLSLQNLSRNTTSAPS